MATPAAVKQLEDQLTCPVCLVFFREPKVLACHHDFCAKCVVKCILRDEQEKQVLVCPTCREHTPLPDGGVASLPASFKTNQLFDVHKTLVEDDNRHQVVNDPPAEAASSLPQAETCCVHAGKVLDLWCNRCNELMCSHCGLEGENHFSHMYSSVSQIHKQYSNDIVSALKPLQEQSSALKDALSLLNVSAKDLRRGQVAAQSALEEVARVFCSAIETKKVNCLGELNYIVEDHMLKMDTRKEILGSILAQREEYVASVQDKLRMEDAAKLISQKSALCLQSSELSGEFQDDLLHQSFEANVRTTFDMDQFTEALQKSIRVYLTDVCPTQCKVDIQSLRQAKVGETSFVILEMFTASGQPCKFPAQNILCQLFLDRSHGKGIELQFLNVDGKYTISVSHAVKGRHRLSIKVEGEHVPGSPFAFHVQSSELNFSRCLGTINTGCEIDSVAVLGNGLVAIASSASVKVYNQRGKLVKSINDWSFSALILQKANTLFAVDKAKQRIFELDLMNETITECAFFQSYQQSNIIADLAVSGEDFVYVLYSIKAQASFVKSLTHSLWGYPDVDLCVKAYDITLSFSAFSFGEVGLGKGQLNSASGISIDGESGNVYIADTGNHRVQVFNKKGEWLSKLGQSVDYSAVAVHSNLVFASDGSHISIFDRYSTNFLTEICYHGSPLHGFVLDESGILYVANSNKQLLLS